MDPAGQHLPLGSSAEDEPVTFPLVVAATLLLLGSFLVIHALIQADQDTPAIRELPQPAVHAAEQRKAA